MRTLASSVVVDPAGRHVGRVHDVYLADRSAEAVAISVELGRLGTRDVLVPISRLRTTGRRRVTVDLPRSEVRAAPPAPATGHLSAQEVLRLRAEGA